MLVKATMAWGIGGASMGRRVAAGYAAAIACGIAVGAWTLRA
jgi:hypothetical protein